MPRHQQRILLGSAAAFALFTTGLVVALSLESGAHGDVRNHKIWTERADATPVDASRPQSFAVLAKTTSPAVVNISTSRTVKHPLKSQYHGPSPFFEFYEKFFGEMPKKFQNRGVGTGFIIHPEGYILTNHHVIENADEIKVKL